MLIFNFIKIVSFRLYSSFSQTQSVDCRAWLLYWLDWSQCWQWWYMKSECWSTQAWVKSLLISDIDKKRKLGFLLSMFIRALFYSIKRRKEHVTSDFERDYFIEKSTKYLCYWRLRRSCFEQKKYKQIVGVTALHKKWLLQKTIKVNPILNVR